MAVLLDTKKCSGGLTKLKVLVIDEAAKCESSKVMGRIGSSLSVCAYNNCISAAVFSPILASPFLGASIYKGLSWEAAKGTLDCGEY